MLPRVGDEFIVSGADGLILAGPDGPFARIRGQAGQVPNRRGMAPDHRADLRNSRLYRITGTQPLGFGASVPGTVLPENGPRTSSRLQSKMTGFRDDHGRKVRVSAGFIPPIWLANWLAFNALQADRAWQRGQGERAASLAGSGTEPEPEPDKGIDPHASSRR